MGPLIKNDVINLQQVVVANNKSQADDNFQHLINEIHRLKQKFVDQNIIGSGLCVSSNENLLELFLNISSPINCQLNEHQIDTIQRHNRNKKDDFTVIFRSQAVKNPFMDAAKKNVWSIVYLHITYLNR
jgi:hypothetical protein